MLLLMLCPNPLKAVTFLLV